MPEINDRMTTTLEGLRSDVERTPLADSLAVRRRGDQRTRRQAIGASLVVVALVAGAVGYLLGGLTGDDEGLGPPAGGGHTATTGVEPTYELTDQPLLAPAGMPTVGPYKGWQVSPDPVPEDYQPSLCVPSPSNLAALETQSAQFYTDIDATAQEHVLRFANAREAESALMRLEGSFSACSPGDPAEATVKDRGPSEGDATQGVTTTMHASRLTTPVQDADISYYELGVAQIGNVLVVLQWSSMGKPPGVEWVLSDQLLVGAAKTASFPVH